MTDIVILTHNDVAYIPLCLEMIKKYTKDYNIIVVDNASNDGSARFATIESKVNLGCGPGRNLGAREGNGEYIAFIDSDVLVSPNWIEKLKERLESEEDIGLVGPYFCNHYGLMYPPRPDIVIGACMFIRRDTFEKIGGFDDEMPFYDDNDIAMKLKSNGLREAYADVMMLHFGGFSISPTEKEKKRLESSRLQFNEKWNTNLPSYLDKKG